MSRPSEVLVLNCWVTATKPDMMLLKQAQDAGEVEQRPAQAIHFVHHHVTAGALRAAQPQPHYVITDLGPAGNPFAQATGINNSGLITGVATATDGSQHAVIWSKGKPLDISQPGLGGPNTIAAGVNERGLVLIQAESSTQDPENFCGFGTGFACLPALWQNGVMTALPLLGGHNGSAGGVNNRGEAAGAAETAMADPDCPKSAFVNQIGPLKFDSVPVVWGPKPGQIRPLPLLGGDTAGMALGINDAGQAVGMSGQCSNTVFPPFVAAPHAVLWDSDGSVINLLNLGGTVDPSVVAAGNAAIAINNRGDVTGTSSLKDNVTHHPFLWTRKTGMIDLGVLPGDNIGAGLAINNQGDVVGGSIAGADPFSGNARAALWSNGQKFDLNDLALPGSPLYLITAFGINDAGQIVGFGADESMNVHAFLATPAQTKAAAGPKDVTVTQKSIQLDGTKSASADGGVLNYSWTIPQGYPSAAISGGSTATPIVEFPLTRGIYMFRLAVTDSAGNTATDSLAVTYMGN